MAPSCLALGPCPCVGSYLALPAVTSVILGDDLFARVTSSSLERLGQRLTRMLPKGGRSGLSKWTGAALGADAAKMGVGLFTDALGSGIRNLNHRSKLDVRENAGKKARQGKRMGTGKGSKGTRAAGGRGAGTSAEDNDEAEDEAKLNEQLLLCPGVVYFLKPRATGDVAMVTTKKGGLGEAILWQVYG